MQTIPLQTRVSKSAAFLPASGNGTLDVSGYTGDWRVYVRVWTLTAAKSVAFELQNVAAADFTGTPVALAVEHYKGPIAAPAEATREIAIKRDKNLNFFGVTNGKIRINVQSIDAAATVDYEAWVVIP